MGKFSDVIDVIFTGAKYSVNEKRQLARLHELSTEFSENFHNSIFALLHIQAVPPLEAKKSENLQIKSFEQDRKQLLNSEIKQIVEDLEGYLGKGKPERIYKIICCALHMMVIDNLFTARDNTVSDIGRRIKEVQIIQNWIIAIMESNDPSFKSDKNFFKLLSSLNDAFDLIEEKLKNEVKIIKQRDLLSEFKGNKYLEGVINSITEYFSALPNNNSGFSVTKLFQTMNRENSEVQKFLKETNIGQFILHLLYNPAMRTLFSIDRESLIAQSLYNSIIDKNPKAGICHELWQNEKAKTEIVSSLEILNQLAKSANISSDLISYFSGRAGNIMLAMGALKEYVNIVIVEMTCDMLKKLQSSLKIIDKTLEDLNLSRLEPIKRAKLKKAYKACEAAIEEAIENYRALNISVNNNSIEKLAIEFQTGVGIIIQSIKNLRDAALPLLSSEQQSRYISRLPAHEASSDSSSIALAPRPALLPSPSQQIAEANTMRVKLEAERATIIVVPRLVQELKGFIAHSPNILEHKTFIIVSRARAENALSGNNANAVAIRKHCEGILQSYLNGRHIRTTLKRVAIGSAAALITGAGAGAIGGAAYFAITAVTATMAVGIGTGVGVGIVAIGFSALYLWKFYNISAERLQGEGTWERLWERMGLAWEEMAKTLGFSAEYERNRQLYLKLFAWYTNVLECVEELKIDVVREFREDYIVQDPHKEFRLKVLEGILAWEPAKDKFLIDELKPEAGSQERILIAGQKLRGMFLYLLKNRSLYFSEGAFISFDGNASLRRSDGARGEKITAGYELDFQDNKTEASDAAKNFFIGFITGTIEEIKSVPTLLATPEVVEIVDQHAIA